MNTQPIFKDKRLLQALEYIDDEYIEDVFNVLKEPDTVQAGYRKQPAFKHWRQYLAAAACLLLLALAAPLFGYLPEIINSVAAGIGADTSSMTESSEFHEETANSIESTGSEQTTQITPNFQYSSVEILSGKASIKPVSVHIGYTWYKDEKSVWTEEIAGWSYIKYMGDYRYENFPHLTLYGYISSVTPNDVTLSTFQVYGTDWQYSEIAFDNISDLTQLPAGDYIVVGFEEVKIPFDKPHSIVGEYDYKLDESVIIFGLTVSEETTEYDYTNNAEADELHETVITPNYLKFVSDLEPISEDKMLEIRKAWYNYRWEYWFEVYYSAYSIHPELYTESGAREAAEEKADAFTKNAEYDWFTVSIYNDHDETSYYYRYYGIISEYVVLAYHQRTTFNYSDEIINKRVGDYTFHFQSGGNIYLYKDGDFITIQDAYSQGNISEEDVAVIHLRHNADYVTCYKNWQKEALYQFFTEGGN